MRRRIALFVAVVMMLTMSFSGAAFAKIKAVPTECETKSGQLPPGQQPECQGGGLEQETENQNPSGKAPPGQNK